MKTALAGDREDEEKALAGLHIQLSVKSLVLFRYSL